MSVKSVLGVSGWIACASVCVALGSTAAHASGPDAWAQHDRDVAAACLAASGLGKAKVVGTPVVFDDRVAQTALLVSGTYPQKHMAGKKGQMLCLYDRKAKTAQAQEWTATPPSK